MHRFSVHGAGRAGLTISLAALLVAAFGVAARSAADGTAPGAPSPTGAAAPAPAETAPPAPPPAGSPAPAPPPGAEVLSLEECVKIALTRSPTYGQAEERLYASHGDVGVSRAALLPQLTLSSSASRADQPFVQYTTTDGIVSSANTYQFGLGVSQRLFDGFSSLNRYHASSLRRDAADAGLHDARLGTRLGVTEAYLGLLRSEHLLEVADQALDASRRRQERFDALFEVGSVAKADVLQNKAQLAQDQLSEISAKNDVEIARATLLNAMGVELSRPIEVSEATLHEPAEAPPLETLLSEAGSNSASLAESRRETAAARADYDAARGGRYPELDFGWQYSYSDYRLPRSFDEVGRHDDWNASLSLRFNLFDGLLTRSSIVSSEHNMEEARLREDQAKLDLSLEVRKQHSSLMETEEQIKVAEESVSSAEESERLQEERYRLGAATLLELIDAQVALTRARTSEVEAKYDHSLAWARLERALGRE